MFYRVVRLIVPSLFCLLFSFSAHAKKSIGTVAILEGDAFIRHGAVEYSDDNSKNKSDKVAEPKILYSDDTKVALKLNDSIFEGDIIETADASYVKVLYQDESIMDIGPSSKLKVEKFVQSGELRQISFKTLFGKIRTLVTKALHGKSSYRVATPVAVMGVRGTDFTVHAYMEKKEYKTDITVLEGKVVVDVAKIAASGKVITTPVAITPGNAFSSSGAPGLIHRFDVSRLTEPQLQKVTTIIPAQIATQRMQAISAKEVRQNPVELKKAPNVIEHNLKRMPSSDGVQPQEKPINGMPQSPNAVRIEPKVGLVAPAPTTLLIPASQPRLPATQPVAPPPVIRPVVQPPVILNPAPIVPKQNETLVRPIIQQRPPLDPNQPPPPPPTGSH